jgi:hypothetical protein
VKLVVGQQPCNNFHVASADEFFTSPEWDEASAAEFDTRIRRVPRKSRFRRYTDKAWALFYRSDGDPVRQRAAIGLIERGVAEQDADDGERAHALVIAAGYAVALGDRTGAIDLARRSIALSARPHIRGPVTAQQLYARCLTDDRDPAARAAWEDFYRFRVAETDGRFQLPAYDALVAREVVDTTGAPVVDPEAAAEGIVVIYQFSEPPEPAVPGIAAADVAALEALDRHYRVMKLSCERRWAPGAVFKEDYLLGTHLPQLGAYVGRVLVRSAAARWHVATPLMRSRVVVGQLAVDPFRAAYDAIYFEASLADFVRRLVSDTRSSA